MKLVCKREQISMKVLLSDNYFGSFYPINCQLLQLHVFSKTNKFLKKWKKNCYPIKTLEEDLIFTQVFSKASDSSLNFQNKSFFSQFYTTRLFLYRKFYNASCFESRNSNASELDPFCHNSTDFESKFLEAISFRKKVLQGIRFWKESDLKKTDFDEISSFRKLLLDKFTPRNANCCSYTFSQKPTID